MTVHLTGDQIAFLDMVDPTDHVQEVCDHRTCHDAFEMRAIEVATALSAYGVSGDSFAAIVLDMTNNLARLHHGNPVASSAIGLDHFIKYACGMAGIAWRQYRDENPDDEANNQL